MPIKRLEHNIDEKKKKTTKSVEEFQKVSIPVVGRKVNLSVVD